MLCGDGIRVRAGAWASIRSSDRICAHVGVSFIVRVRVRYTAGLRVKVGARARVAVTCTLP